MEGKWKFKASAVNALKALTNKNAILEFAI